LTFLAALRCDRIAAPCVIDGPINGTSFRAFVEQFLLPILSAGDIVIMDNLGSHKGQAVRQLIRSAGAKLFFLPRYSPDLNPIDYAAHKMSPVHGHAFNSRLSSFKKLQSVLSAMLLLGLDLIRPASCRRSA